MKIILTRILLLLLVLTTTVGLSPLAHAAPEGFYLNPSTGTYQKDTSFAVQLRLNAGSNSGIQSNLDFDTSKLQVAGISNQGSALDSVTTSHDNTAGRISVYSVSGSGSGDRLITTITFRAISGGVAPVNFAGSNQTLRYVLLLPIWSNMTTNSTSYTIAGPTTPPTPPTTGGGNPTPPTGSTGGNQSSSPSAKPTTPSAHTPTAPTTSSENTTAPITTTPDNPLSSDSKYKTSPDFQTTKPNADPWENDNSAASTSQILIPWLPIIITSALALLGLAIFGVYRRTHLSKSLRRLLAAIVSYKIGASEKKPIFTPSFHFPVIAKIMPKLLAYTSPKLLASGIRQRLLSAGNNFTKRK